MIRRAVRNTLVFLFFIMLVICISPVLVRAQGDGSGVRAGAYGAPAVEFMLGKVAANNGVTLQAALQDAIETNPSFLARKHAYSSSHEAYLKSFGALLPQVDFVARGGYAAIRNDTTIAMYSDDLGKEWSNDMRVVLSQLIFDGGMTSSKVEADKYLSQSRREELFNAAEDVGLTATQYFMEVIRNRALIELCENNITQHAGILELTRVRLSSGGGTQVDVDQAQASLEEAKSRLVQARQGLADAEAGYLKLFGVKADKLAMPDRPVQAIPESLDAGVALAMDNNRALKAARLAIQQREREAESAKGLYMPKLQANLSGGAVRKYGRLRAALP